MSTKLPEDVLHLLTDKYPEVEHFVKQVDTKPTRLEFNYGDILEEHYLSIDRHPYYLYHHGEFVAKSYFGVTEYSPTKLIYFHISPILWTGYNWDLKIIYQLGETLYIYFLDEKKTYNAVNKFKEKLGDK